MGVSFLVGQHRLEPLQEVWISIPRGTFEMGLDACGQVCQKAGSPSLEDSVSKSVTQGENLRWAGSFVAWKGGFLGQVAGDEAGVVGGDRTRLGLEGLANPC